jgi:hypothetical protein
MASILLPPGIVPNALTPFLRDWGGILEPFLGGAEQRINRPGMRLGGRFSIPPKVYATDGMMLISRLMQAKASRIIVDWPQPGFDPGDEGTPKVKVAVSGGTTLQIKGLPADKPLVEGQFLTIVKAATGRKYLHHLSAGAVVDGTGDATVGVWPPMRTNFAVNDVIQIANPQIEGHVQPGDELSWQLSVERLVDVAFTVSEAA